MKGAWIKMNWSRVLCNGGALASLGFFYLGHCFMEPGDYQDTPFSETLHFAWSVESLRGWHRMHNRWSQCKDWSKPTPYSLIHTDTSVLMVTRHALPPVHLMFLPDMPEGGMTKPAPSSFLVLVSQLSFFWEVFLWVSPLAVSSKMADTPTLSANGLFSLAVLTFWQIWSHGHSNLICRGRWILAASVIGFIGG